MIKTIILENSKYRIKKYYCDRCNTEISFEDYTLKRVYIEHRKNTKKLMFDLCNRCYNSLKRGVEKGIQRGARKMITKEFLDSIENINGELTSLKRRLAKIENKEHTIIADSVQGSGTSFPYVKHSIKIEGIEIPKDKNLKNKYKKMIKHKQYKLDKLRLQLEYELNYIKEAEIREILRYKYNDNKTWLQIMFSMNYNSESTAKMKLERFLKKYKNVTNVTI